MKRADKSKDGEIDLQEFCVLMKNQTSQTRSIINNIKKYASAIIETRQHN